MVVLVEMNKLFSIRHKMIWEMISFSDVNLEISITDVLLHDVSRVRFARRVYFRHHVLQFVQ